MGEDFNSVVVLQADEQRKELVSEPETIHPRMDMSCASRKPVIKSTTEQQTLQSDRESVAAQTTDRVRHV